RTVAYKGYRFDIGGHRFFTKVPEIQALWEDALGEAFLTRPRLSRIYYRDRFFDYPLKPLNALRGLGLIEAVRILVSYGRARLVPLPEERTFEEWVVNRFGRRLYEVFFKTYTEKVWGIPCGEIGADWAAQRIRNLDLKVAVRTALLGQREGGGVVTTLIDQFYYPRLGPGMMWERWRDRLAARGAATVLGAEVTRLHHANGRVDAVTVRHRAGGEERVAAGHVISTMPLRTLIQRLDPPPPAGVQAAADRLRYRDFLTVVLIVDDPAVFPDNWIYIHAPDVRVGRIQNFKNWSPDMVPDAAMTSLGLEYFVQEGDALWTMPDADLISLGTREVARLGLIAPETVRDGTVIRARKAYPIYDGAYREALDTVRAHLEGFANLQCIGRNGQHRYNNQDHSMVTGLLAARNCAGAAHDIWAVNVDATYHEAADERLVPERVAEPTLEELLASAFARYDPVALGLAVAVVAAAGLLLASALLMLGDRPPLPPLSLLGQYLYGYTLTWKGLGVGTAEAAVGGFVFGAVLAGAINLLVRWHETLLRRELQVAGTLDPLEGEGAFR
ncbi:MAG: NAD(P)/FAD-dependent oxidoreductase, partial [Gemmatimonadota bacterium]